MTKKTEQFLKASETMMKSLDEAEGLGSHHLECYRHSFYQLITQMIDDANYKEISERAEKRYPMGRKDS